MEKKRTYLCIDLKSFYASVECVDRGFDPMGARLVVADPERSRTTICLAVSPALKELGVKNRCRVFEIPEGIDYTMARPRMRRYMEVSASVYALYLKRVSAQDVHVYSIDECFIDITPYLVLYRTDARSFARTLIGDVRRETGIPATAGIGDNLFLAKVALDVCAKHAPDGIGRLDEATFRRDIWFHRPITDIWGIGPGIARRLEKYGARDLASVAALREETLYREFGTNAEFLIDHAWGQEPCTIAEIQSYVPEGRSMTNGQVLPGNYSFDEARMVLREMIDASVLELVESHQAADRISIFIGYARDESAPRDAKTFEGGHGTRPLRGYGCEHTGGMRSLGQKTNSRRILSKSFLALFDETTHRDMPIKRINIGISGLVPEDSVPPALFDDAEDAARERRMQETIVDIRSKFGKNAMLKGTSLQEKATARERNNQIGGHRA